jgi:hypothetical protein
METTGITPAVSVYISCGSLFVAACALALELRRWFDEGVKLRINVMAEAKIAGGLRPDDNSYVAAHVANRGDAATTITHMYLEFFPTKFARFVGRLPLTLRRWIKKQKPKTFLVPNPILPGCVGTLPYVLNPGHDWHGMAIHTPELRKMIDSGRVYVCIIGSHSIKPVRGRVLISAPPENSRKLP